MASLIGSPRPTILQVSEVVTQLRLHQADLVTHAALAFKTTYLPGTMKTLLTITGVLEATLGLALVAWPSAPVAVILGSSLDTPAAVTISQVAGAALLALGVACWLASNDVQSRAASGLIAAMLLYNAAVVVLLTRAGIASGLVGIGLWPGVILHLAMGVWCVACLRVKSTSQ